MARNKRKKTLFVWITLSPVGRINENFPTDNKNKLES